MSKGDNTRKFIIERAASIFHTKGISSTTICDILTATKLSKGSLYFHFENKEELVKDAVDYTISLIEERITISLNKTGSAKDKLLTYIKLYDTPITSYVKGQFPVLNLSAETDQTDEYIRNKVNMTIKYNQQTISYIIKKGIQEGEFKAGWNFTEFAMVMFSMIEGALLLCSVAGSEIQMKVVSGALKNMIESQCNHF